MADLTRPAAVHPQPVRVITARAVGHVLAAVAAWDGVILTIGGPALATQPAWAALRAFPGLNVLGLIYLASAAVLLRALHRPGELLAWVLSGGIALHIMVAASYVISDRLTTGQIVWTVLSKPLSLATLWLLVLLARPMVPVHPGRRPDRKRADRGTHLH